MNTLLKSTLALFIMAVSSVGLLAQTTILGNNGTSAAQYLGWNNGTAFPLRVEHMGDTTIHIRTNGMDRMTFRELDNWNGLNGESATNVSRVTMGHNGENNRAWSMLHLWEGSLGARMQRSWMNVGTSYTGNSDFMYTGLFERPVSGATSASRLATDAVIAWGCQNSMNSANVDNFRILFLNSTPLNGGPPQDPESTMQGQEVLRITPWGNMGVGDFSTMTWNDGTGPQGGLAQQPTHRLDIAGKTRMRYVDTLMNADVRDVLLAGKFQSPGVDFEVQHIRFTENPNEYLGGDGLWHDIPTGGTGGADCDWAPDINGNSGLDDNVVTGFPNNPAECGRGNVGIGTQPKAKLDVALNSGSNYPYGPDVLYSSPDAIHGYIKVTNNLNRAIYGENASTGDDNYGGYFQSTISNNNNYGVYGNAINGGRNYGVYGRVTGTYLTNNYAGYFDGDVFCTSGTFSPSDAQLKENVVELENALELITQLSPKSYNYLNEEYSSMNLPEGNRNGFIAQELEEVFPGLVKESVNPASYNAEGEVIAPEIEFKAINYVELIPVLTAGIQEQQTQIEALNARLDDMEAALADCCVGEKSNTGSATKSIRADYELYQNRPNPFSTSTEIIWRMADEAQARIIVQDAQGKAIATLKDGNMSKGLHSVEWNAEDLPVGTYFYSLEVNGELIVKRAIKLER